MTTNTSHAAHDAASHGHPPHLAHHFETPAQQFSTGKVGMWTFLATEILMFGGLFCAYAVYRQNHPDVFVYAHQYLDKNLGALNTVILITSSLTMAWAVRLAQLNKRRGLILCLAATLLGGAGFMVVKSIEYTTKYEHHLWIGAHNRYDSRYKGDHADPAHQKPQSVTQVTPPDRGGLDPNAGTGDAPRLGRTADAPWGLSTASPFAQEHGLPASELDRKRISTFFSIYFLMTGLHGLHVLIGMGLITWILVRSALGHFSSDYFAPVDLVGLYWHLVDLIWIFLFPLLYLIH